jgi:SAM-dependent methyltransferase
MMERSAYEEMAATDEVHWWYRARRRIVSDVIERFIQPPADSQIAEIGCGTGANLAVLERFGALTGVEPDAQARAFAQTRSHATILEGYLPDELPFSDASLDLAVMLDVLEHVDDDVAALKAVAAKLRPGARFLLTVPAMTIPWSSHDDAHHHKRRYSVETLTAAFHAAGLKVERLSYFNTLLFPLIAGVRWTKNALNSTSADTNMPPAWLNSILEAIFSCERALIGRIPMPIGVSLMAIVRRQ